MNVNKDKQNKPINLNKIVLNGFMNNKKLIVSLIITFIAYILLHIIFPKACAKILDQAETINIKKILIGVAPFVIAQILFYGADRMYSTSIPDFENSIINELLQDILISQKDNNVQVKRTAILTNVLKVFEIKNIIHVLSAYFIPALFITIGLFIYFLNINKNLAYTSLIIIIVSFGILIIYSRTCLKESIIRDQHHNEYTDQINDIIHNIDKVIISNTIPFEVNRINKIKDEVRKYYVKSELTNSNMKGLIGLISIIILFVLGNKLLGLFRDNKMSKGDLIAYMYIVLSLLNYYDSASYEINRLFYYIGNYVEGKDFFAKFSMNNKENFNQLKITDGKIEIAHLKMKLGDKQLFDGFNVVFKPGLKTGIVGQIGTGKSTLLKIIMKLYEYEGIITIDGQDIKDLDNNELRRHLGYLPQHPTYFNRTLMDNLIYGIDEKTNPKQRLVALIKEYDLEEFINRFDEGLDTMVVKNGENLSGGQKQILYFLKTLLEDKKIILMDEPTSSLDEYHKKIFTGILGKIHDKTILIVTHDKDLYIYLDKIIEVKKN